MDGGSGVASCDGPVASGAALVTSVVGAREFVVDAKDRVGNAARAVRSYTVSFNVCPLYDASKARPASGTFPLKFQLCDAAGTNASSVAIAVSATGLTQVSTNAPGVLEAAGNANPDNDFRFDSALAGYVYNLKTTGFATGTYRLTFTVAGDPSEHMLEFQVK